MKWLLPILLFCLLCLSSKAQYIATHYIDFEGGANGNDVASGTLDASVHGPAMTGWGIHDTPAGALTFSTTASKQLLGNITVYGAGTFGPAGTLGLKSKLDTSTAYITPSWGDNGSTSATVGLWMNTDVPQATNAINIDWFTLRTVGGQFNNVILYGPGDGSLKFSMEISVGTPDTGTIAISRNTWYWVLLGINIGGTNGNIIRVYDTSMSIVGELHNSAAYGANPNPFRCEIGCANGANAGSAGYNVFVDTVMIETNGVFPILPGPIGCTYAPPPSNSITWTVGGNVGVQGGIPHRTTIYTNFTSANVVGEINNGISNCTSNQVVKLGPGYYSIASSINLLKNGVTLRGSGSGTNPAVDTILRASANIGTFVNIGLESSQSGTTISSGWAKGASNLTVASTSGFNVGQLVNAVEKMDTNVMWTAATGDSVGTNYLIQHHAVITAIVGSVITIWPPLTYELTPHPSPQLLQYGDPTFQVVYSGIEDLTIDPNGKQVDFAVTMEQFINCWHSNITMLDINGYVDYNLSGVFGEITYCTIPGQRNYGTSHGGILLGGQHNFGVSGMYCYNNIILLCNPAIQVNGMDGSVVAGNLCPNSQFSDLTAVSAFVFNHTGDEPNNNLYEENIWNNADSDGFTAGVVSDTLFRNWGIGYTIASTNYNSRPLSLAHWARYWNVIGDVWGNTNFTPTLFTMTNLNYSYQTSVVEILGYPNGAGNGSYSGVAPPWTDRANNLDYDVTNTCIIHANWDSKNLSQLFYSGQCATLPDSLYLASKPTGWWPSSLPWPGINPVVGYTNLWWTSIPAGLRLAQSAIAGSGYAVLSGPATLTGPAKLYSQ